MRPLKRSDLPFVYVNVAMTADGKITTANRRVEAFSSPRDREHMYELRVKADAVMAGARTVDLNPVTMGPGGRSYRQQRKRHGRAEYNLRVVVSGRGSVAPGAKLFERTFSPVILITTQQAPRRRLEKLKRLGVDIRICGKAEVDFVDALRWLKKEWKVNSLLCEGGGQLNEALFRAGLVDELHLTICPKVFGGQAAPTLSDGHGFSTLAQGTSLRLKRSRRIGDELFLVYQVR